MGRLRPRPISEEAYEAAFAEAGYSGTVVSFGVSHRWGDTAFFELPNGFTDSFPLVYLPLRQSTRLFFIRQLVKRAVGKNIDRKFVAGASGEHFLPMPSLIIRLPAFMTAEGPEG
jgi:hypothetical protein